MSQRTTPARRAPARLVPALAAAALALAAAGLPGCGRDITDNDIVRVGVDNAAALSRDARNDNRAIVDVRRAEDYRAGHIPGALNIRLEYLSTEGRHPDLTDRKPILVYGDNPGSAAAVAMAKRLMVAGYKDVRLFEGGYDAWTRAGLPVDTGE